MTTASPHSALSYKQRIPKSNTLAMDSFLARGKYFSHLNNFYICRWPFYEYVTVFLFLPAMCLAELWNPMINWNKLYLGGFNVNDCLYIFVSCYKLFSVLLCFMCTQNMFLSRHERTMKLYQLYLQWWCDLYLMLNTHFHFCTFSV